jgi:flagella basal body P-ring formation protein FlgA
MVTRVSALLAGMLFFAAGVAFGQESTLVEKRLTGLLKNEYGRTGVYVKLEGVPAHLKHATRIRSVKLHKVPDISGKGLAIVEAEAEDGSVRASYVPFKVFETRTLFYAKRAMAKGNPIGIEDVDSKETTVSHSELVYPKDLEALLGKVLKKDVAAGTVLTNTILDSPQVIRRGEMVTIVGESKLLSVKAKGKAEEPGRLGDRIRVRNLSSGREVFGTVTEGRVVTVDF